MSLSADRSFKSSEDSYIYWMQVGGVYQYLHVRILNSRADLATHSKSITSARDGGVLESEVYGGGHIDILVTCGSRPY